MYKTNRSSAVGVFTRTAMVIIFMIITNKTPLIAGGDIIEMGENDLLKVTKVLRVDKVSGGSEVLCQTWHSPTAKWSKETTTIVGLPESATFSGQIIRAVSSQEETRWICLDKVNSEILGIMLPKEVSKQPEGRRYSFTYAIFDTVVKPCKRDLRKSRPMEK